MSNPAHFLLIEDNLADVRLVQEAIKESGRHIQLAVVYDGIEAMMYLQGQGKYSQRVMPQLILLDLNLPKKNGIEVLDEIKHDNGLRKIPVVVLTSSKSVGDISKSYDCLANCFVCKPLELEDFMQTMDEITKFWLDVAKLPLQV